MTTRVKQGVVRALPQILASLLVCSWLGSASAGSSQHYHTVASGQRLGSIAKRYGVTIEALCTANGIERKQRLKVGQKLLVPGRDDRDGSMTRRQYGPPDRQLVDRQLVGESDRGETLLASISQPLRQATHRVYAGQRLESIARRYQVSIEALCEANRIRQSDKLKPGQVLVIPGSLPEIRLSKLDEHRQDLQRPSKPVKKGYIEMANYTARYRGVVFDRKGKVAPGAIESISKLFGATGSRPRVHPRLIALLADVSEHFGGRPLRVVSGWRDHSYFEDSRHKHSKAIDFSIPGVSNTVLRDYVRRFRNCGVGYYPNSSFVHLDVRESAAYWVDYAGPGEAPRNKPQPDPKEAVAAGERSGPIEEAGGEVEDRPVSATASATVNATASATAAAAAAVTTVRPATDITSGASRSGPVTPGASEAPALSP
ncbi:MAG TPA: LysM peptidoglycan-binding domain-containing protein [Polyangiaceae bacterium]|nr:LysM peptidoglycan-binding domain-containing protein [Polyangiaceae bacterium]